MRSILFNVFGLFRCFFFNQQSKMGSWSDDTVKVFLIVRTLVFFARYVVVWSDVRDIQKIDGVLQITYPAR
jgi:hypothetical protein